MRNSTLFAYYDLSRAPATFDIITFLFIAEIERIDRGLDEIELRILANSGGGFRSAAHRGLEHVQGSNPAVDDLQQRLENILLPAANLMPSCARAIFISNREEAQRLFDPADENFPNQYSVESPKISYFESSILIAQHMGKRLGSLRAPFEAVERAGRWLDENTNGKRAIVITIRDLPYHPLRNSNIKAWSEFAKSLDSSDFCPVIVRDTEHVGSVVRPEFAGFPICDEAALDLEFRMALYESAYLNLAVSGGPILLCMCNNATRYIRFKMLAEQNPHGGPALYYSIGLEPGSSFSHATTFQELVWRNDDYPVIRDAFNVMVERIETQKFPRQRELPSVIDTAKRFSVGGNNVDAEKICRLILQSQPDNMEIAYILATVLQNTDRHTEALTVLEKLRARAGENPAILVPTVTSLFLTGRAQEARELADEVLGLVGEDRQLLQWIGRILLQMGQDSAGRIALIKCIQLNPEDSSPHVDLARHYHSNNLSVPRAIEHFDKALEIGQPDPLLPLELADCHSRLGHFEVAAALMESTLDATGFNALNSLIPMGIVQRLANRESRSIETFEKALKTIRDLLEGEDENDTAYTDVLAGEAQTLLLLGRPEEARACLARARQLRSLDTYHYDPKFYLSNTPQRIDRLRRIVDGRDILIFCHGPTITNMDSWWPKFQEFDTCLFGVNKFSVFESGFLKEFGRLIDVNIRSHHQDIKPSIDQVEEFLSRPNNNVMFTAHWAMNKIGGAGIDREAFETRFDEKLIYFGAADGWLPASPNQPLHMKQGNALSTFLTMAAIGKPKRIFIFGADGGVDATNSRPTHYGANSDEFRLNVDTEKRDTMSATLRVDAAMFDIYSPINLLAAEYLFDLTPPEIYNVSPGSALKSITCIDYAQAFDLMADQ